MNKGELVKKLASKSGMSQTNAQKALDAILDTVSEELRQGGKVNLVGFGTFSVSHRQDRKGRNPQTGEEILVPGGNVPKFKPGKALREAVDK